MIMFFPILHSVFPAIEFSAFAILSVDGRLQLIVSGSGF